MNRIVQAGVSVSSACLGGSGADITNPEECVHITDPAGGDLLTTAPGPDSYNTLTHTGLDCMCVGERH